MLARQISPGGTGVDLVSGGIQVCYYCGKDNQRPPDMRITVGPGESVVKLAAGRIASGWRDGVRISNRYELGRTRRKRQRVLAFFALAAETRLLLQWSQPTTHPGQFLSDTLASPVPPQQPYAGLMTRQRRLVASGFPSAGYCGGSGPRAAVGVHTLAPSLFGCHVRVMLPLGASFFLARRGVGWKFKGSYAKRKSQGAAGRRFIMDFDGSYALRPKRNDQNKGEYTLKANSLAEVKGRYFSRVCTPASPPEHD